MFRFSKGKGTYQLVGMNIIVGGGGDLSQLNKHGGWKISNVTDGYIDDTMYNKIESFKKYPFKLRSKF